MALTRRRAELSDHVARWGEGTDQSRLVGPGRIDKSVYTDPERLACEREKLFRRTWLVADRVEVIPNPGDFLVWERIGQSVIIARLEDGSLSAFHNVCRHRGARIAAEGGHCDTGRLSCPFHGFNYDLRGNVVSVPERDSFDPAHLEGLRAVPVAIDTWQGFIWLNFDPENCEPLDVFLGPLKDELGWYGMDEWKFYGGNSWTANANWKVVLEGFLEAWHTPTTHKATVRGGFDVPRSSFSLLDRHSMMVVPITRNDIDSAPKPIEHRAIADCQYLAFPNTFANMFPDLGNLVSMYPIDENTTLAQGWVVARREAPEGVDYAKFDADTKRSLGLTDRIMAEDLFISNQIGVNRDSFGYQGNIYNTLECRITAFHQEIEKYLVR
jgi:phenylpropionate dioxygenase-like ring-hydroxylating dioxygenase large terminal subunit